MEQILNFLRNNYSLIVCCLTLLLNILFFILKKRPSSAVFSELLLALKEILPKFISQAEEVYKNCSSSGSVKKQFVSSLSLEFSERYLHRKLDSDEIPVLKDFISDSIECILSTPTKKGAFK